MKPVLLSAIENSLLSWKLLIFIRVLPIFPTHTATKKLFAREVVEPDGSTTRKVCFEIEAHAHTFFS